MSASKSAKIQTPEAKSDRELLKILSSGKALTESQSQRYFQSMIDGTLDPVHLAAGLMAMKVRGETVAELVGAALALRNASHPLAEVPANAMDVCGTGGDGIPTVNVSTMVALIGAEAGIPMVKHGNRGVSSNCGSADVLERFGVALETSPTVARHSLEVTQFCYLHAPVYHPGVRFAMPVRKALGIRTLLNLLGPLVNPAQPKIQMMGIYDPQWGKPVAETMSKLGVQKAYVVHGGGMDEVALHAPTTVHAMEEGVHSSFQITPEQAGFRTISFDELYTPSVSEKLARFEAMLEGRGNDADNALVAINAGVMLLLAGQVDTLKAGSQQALDILRSGQLRTRLQSIAEASNAKL